MASRVQQDTFIDDSDETCPLCVEEFDLSDRNFRPCPCGYQVCQFCFNNIKTNMNGLCPACRRPYDEKTIEWKVVSPEEFKADVQKQARKKAEIRQKEAQKREVESLNRKHLSGLRVVQKNLVYVVGLNPRIREEDLLQTLRGEQYFGQYGKIVKIVVSKTKDGGHGAQPLGVYVTFARKQDAEKCIAAVDGSENGGRTLRAQFGTTKYCSAYLRNETCSNKSCMFLHEPGEEKDSFTRQDLSSINVVSTQRPAQSTTSSSSSPPSVASNQLQPQVPPPPSQATSHKGPANPPVAAAQTMGRQASRDGTISPTESGDGSALPSTASWANKGTQQQSRRTSYSYSASAPSPVPTKATVSNQGRESNRSGIAPSSTTSEQNEEQPLQPGTVSGSITIQQDPGSQKYQISHPFLDELLTSVTSPHFKFVFCSSQFTTEDLEAISSYPPLLDPRGGAKRRAVREMEESQQKKRDDEERGLLQVTLDPQMEDLPGSGSLQLGGEPESTSDAGDGHARMDHRQGSVDQQRLLLQSSGYGGGSAFPQSIGFDQDLAPTNVPSHGQGSQSINPLMHQYPNKPSTFMEQLSHRGLSNQARQPQIGLFQNQTPNLQLSAQGHARQSSRYSFANDSTTASAAVKPAANAKLMAQQSAMMPPGSSNNQVPQIGIQQHSAGPFYTGAVQGPPPGLKSTGLMFESQYPNGPGGAFGGTGIKAGGEESAENGQDLFRMRGPHRGTGGTPSTDAGKRESMFPSFLHQFPSTSTSPAPAPGLLGSFYGSQAVATQDPGMQRQKKKGKKHRNANTSSSGGGGIVNLADPGILQARMPQQSGSGGGQGLFSGQGQDEHAQALEVVTRTIGNLLEDETLKVLEDDVKRPLSPPPSTDTVQIDNSTGTTGILQAATSGLPRQPESTTPSSAVEKPVSCSESVAAYSPRSPAPDIILAGSARDKRQDTSTNENVPTQQGQVASTGTEQRHKLGMTVTKESIEALVKSTPAAYSINTGRRLNRGDNTTSAKGGASKEASSVKGGDVGKRSLPGKLNIAAATYKGGSSATSTTLSAKGEMAENRLNDIRSNTPAMSVRDQDFPALRTTQPKTIRLVATPKTEAPNPLSAPGSTVLASPVSKLPSRKPSVASLQYPTTPASEIISDTASLTSASLSRANSPPPPKVGSAPTRQTTKSQLKKARKEAKKEHEIKEQEATAFNPPVEEKEIAPIIGRKKKQKSKVTKGSTSAASPVVSRAPSPSPTEVKVKEKEREGKKEVEEEKVAPKTPAATSSKAVKPELKAEPKAEPKPTEPALDNVEKKKAAAAKAATMAALPDKVAESPQLDVADLRSSKDPLLKGINLSTIVAPFVGVGELHANHVLFKAPPGISHRYEFESEDYVLLDKFPISIDEQSDLSAGLPIRKSSGNDVEEGRGIMISPAGILLRGLTREQESRYLELESRVSTTPTPLVFRPRLECPVGDNGFSIVGGRVVHHGTPARTAGPDAASKVRVDESLDYVNQFVLPTLPPAAGSAGIENAMHIDTGLARHETSAMNAALGDANSSTMLGFPVSSSKFVESEMAASLVSPVPFTGDESRYSASASAATRGLGALTSSAADDDFRSSTGRGMVGPTSLADGGVAATTSGKDWPAMPLLGIEEAEKKLVAARKESEAIEKKLLGLIKKNRKIVVSSVQAIMKQVA